MVELQLNDNVLHIKGDIKTIDDFEKIKSMLDDITSADVVLRIEDSKYITSSLIGHLYKLKDKYNKSIIVQIGNEDLTEVFEDLGLVNEFKVESI
ncbi:MAG: hypothetical protein GXO62_00740 [Epsilonproteobacteria bacterium]|nr:hypothetical protein [Campylobacterota bacterium]